MAFDYDLFVIGGGSGGVRAARIAAGEMGAKVGLAESSRLGGTCVIRGCVPKKLMVFASQGPTLLAEARDYGWQTEIGGFDWPGFRGNLEAELDRLEGIYGRLLDNSGVITHAEHAKIISPHEVELASGTRFSAKHILIAVGGWPTKPGIEGEEHAITSNEVFHLDRLPERMLIVGGGYIASEFACILNGLGVSVTQYYRGNQILRGFDDEARALVADEMRRKGVNLLTNINATRIVKTDQGLRVTATDGSEQLFDQVMLATGRQPNTAHLGLENIGLTLGKNGEIPVDQFSQTAVPSVYAIGDVTDRVALTPVAIHEGMAFVETVFGATPTQPDHAMIPTAIFTQPELGTIGLSEEAARETEPVEVYATRFRPMRTAFLDHPDQALMKLIVSKASRTVLGCHIVAEGAGEMIQLAGIAMKMGATKEDFDRTMAVHPTISEELVTMRKPVR